jgi:large subunit ribosomal protein L10
MILAEYKLRFQDVPDAILIDIRGINANDNNTLRLALAEKDIRVTVVKNSLACKAFAGTGLEALSSALQGPSAVAWGAESVVDVARELVEWSRKVGELDLKAAVLDGELFEGEAGVKQLSAFPTKVEAQARVVQLVLSPGAAVVGAACAPGARILGIVKEIQDRLEKGEAISKTA